MDGAPMTDQPRCGPGLPSIRVDDPHESSHHDGARLLRRSQPLDCGPISIASAPMSIPNATEPVPPPLPPPRHIDDLDIAWRLARHDSDRQNNLPPIQSGSSLIRGLSRANLADDRPESDQDRRSSSSSTVAASADAQVRREGSSPRWDEGYASLSGSALHGHRLKGEEPLRNASQSSVDKAYDKSLLDRLGSARSDPAKPALTTTSLSSFSPRSLGRGGTDSASIASGLSSLRSDGNLPSSFSIPDRVLCSTPTSMDDSKGRWAGLPDSAISMGTPKRGLPAQPLPASRRAQGRADSVSSLFGADANRASRDYPLRPARRGSALGDHDDASTAGRLSQTGVYEQIIYAEPEPEVCREESRMKRLHLGDMDMDRTPPRPGRHRYSPGSKAGQKRRASSPHREREERLLLATSGNANELFHRRSSGHLSNQRLSPTSRFQQASLSSTSSGPRNGSSISSGTMTISNGPTTTSCSGRLSPRNASPTSELGSGTGSPYVSSSSLNPSPPSSMSRAHNRTTSESRMAQGALKSLGEESSAMKQHGPSRLQGVYICECCPKKPKKFDTEEELRVHEMEKQYTCQYCHNRFKNKNEAERHQNSLHLRRHSWSCAALSDYKAAFHPSPYKASSADVCGYCGEDFALPANWEARVEHLTSVHKFGECNQAKKFFRADHFRQHLKHSHAGTSGKWTNMLENACMKDEPPPEKIGFGGGGGDAVGGLKGTVIDEEMRG